MTFTDFLKRDAAIYLGGVVPWILFAFATEDPFSVPNSNNEMLDGIIWILVPAVLLAHLPLALLVTWATRRVRRLAWLAAIGFAVAVGIPLLSGLVEQFM